MEMYTTLFNKFTIFGMGMDWAGLVHTVWGLHAWAYEYEVGSDPVCLSADLFLSLTNIGLICHKIMIWTPIFFVFI